MSASPPSSSGKFSFHVAASLLSFGGLPFVSPAVIPERSRKAHVKTSGSKRR
jgi:hypothetical protein